MLRTQNIINLNDFSTNPVIADFIAKLEERLNPPTPDDLWISFDNALQREDLVSGIALGILATLRILPLATLVAGCSYFTKPFAFNECIDPTIFVPKQYTCELS